MFAFLKTFQQRSEGRQKYEAGLEHMLQGGKFTASAKASLESIQKQYGLRPKDVAPLQRKAAASYFQHAAKDRRLTKTEIDTLNQFVGLFDLKPEDFGFDQELFNRYAILAAIDQGTLPEVEITASIPLEPGEKVHFGCPVALRKHRKVATSVNYSGPSVSIRIMKGVRYRVGSASISRQTENVLAVEDFGILYITNQKVLFNGEKRRVTVALDKVESFELREEGLFVHKAGKELPHIFTMDDYEVPAAVLSVLVNS